MPPPTLHYQRPDSGPNAKAGLVVLGILFLLGGEFCTFLGFSTFMLGLTLAMGRLSYSSTVIYFSTFGLVVGVLLVYVGAGSILQRRWVRPLALTVTGWACITTALSLVEMVLQFSSPTGRSTNFLMGVCMSALRAALSLASFYFYRSNIVIEALNLHSPQPTWTDRWSPATLAIGSIAIFNATLSLVFALPIASQHSPSATYLPLAAQALLATLTLLAGVTTLRRPTLGWSLLLATLLATAAFTLTTPLLFPQARLATTIGTLPPTPSPRTLPADLAPFPAYITALLLLRKHLPLKPRPLSPPPPREVLPLEPQQPNSPPHP